MKKLEDLLQKINDNKAAIAAHGKFDKEILKKINYKFRLDWNYHSNKIEGGTLTLEETKHVMASIIKSDSGKPKKDFIEMDGHDKQVVDILKVAKGEQRIAPKRIRALHKGIMYEDDPKKLAKIGEWKKENNYLLNYKGERTDFLPYSEVPEAIQELCNWINAQFDTIENKKETEHPLILAAEFHLRYINIHPFYDGNGRTARLLANLILIACDYPPIIVKDAQKDEYGKSLAEVQEYGAPSTLFYQFMAERLIESQELMLKALAGESIEEEDDLEKEFALLDQQFEALSSEKEVKLLLGDVDFEQVIEGWYSNLMYSIITTTEKFKKYFLGVEYEFSINRDNTRLADPKHYKLALINYFKKRVEESKLNNRMYQLETSLDVDYNKFKKGGTKELNDSSRFIIDFRETTYSIIINQFDKERKERFNRKIITKLLSEPLEDKEVEKICKIVEENLIESVKQLIEQVK